MRTIEILTVILIFTTSYSKAQQDTIIYNQSTGNYTVQYIDQDGSLVVQTYIPWNKINPIVNCMVEFSENSDEYVYNWRIKNGEDSEQNLNSFILRFGDPNVTNQSICGWHNMRLYEKDGITLSNLWSWWGDQGLEPTWEVDGFALGSSGLPSIGVSYFQGRGGSVLSFSFSPPPDKIMKEFAKIDGFPGGYILRKTIVPGKIPDQLIPSSLIDTLLNYNTQSFELGWIKDEPTKTKYENYFTKTKDALVKGDTSSVRTYLEKVLTDADIDSTSTLSSEAYALLRYNTEYLLKHFRQ